MPAAPTPDEVFDRAVEEGQRRLDQSLLELVSTSFIAGFTIVFGLVGLGIVESRLQPVGHGVAALGGAVAFGVGIVFLVAGRTELFNENFSDPTAAAVDSGEVTALWALLRLWVVTLVGNLVGGGLFSLVFVVEGAVPAGTPAVLAAVATESVGRDLLASFARAIAGGALVSLLSFLLVSVDNEGSRLALSYVVGVLLALGPLEHVIVTALHVFLGVLFGAGVGATRFTIVVSVVTAGNIVGGLGLVTFAHVAQAAGART
ncbi:formate/nitrite transporter family protein [Haloarcula salinisoli]|uniref:Formate/nitrite transporter family protein n=1 Tax=Haloarcula salinisoli TaxID=2487746 RepID=A0A8J7YJJ6_9EURY|nr:formate/nitrite transporter family protein [Halomicroarcula salinisoli]MBX0287815.1 formate/nitrite transporter family protein [Halomicroarcula salinisoli]MBX0304758.1 formate/nitrite transporter family protein [Halomicroarcula salinisoli]